MMDTYLAENLSHDPVHGYIRFVATEGRPECEICERQIIDHHWVQRMRQIRQLQTAWWVYPTAEHSRFQHILGVMHLASQAVERLYPSLAEVDSTTPSKQIVESTVRMAGLLHDVGHGPFGHFFDAHYLSRYGLTHETLGALIISQELASELTQLQSTLSGKFQDGARIDPAHIAWLIQRPTPKDSGANGHGAAIPRWLQLLRSLFCGIYTIDNMDFVLRDAFMTGLNPRAFDLQRILHYSFYSPSGLTIYDRGMPALTHFLSMKAELFRNVYFHRTVRAIDLELIDLFRDSHDLLFPGDPRDYLQQYLELTEFSLLTDVRRWHRSQDPRIQKVGSRWLNWLARKTPWAMVAQRNVSFTAEQSENSSVFSSEHILTEAVRAKLPSDSQDMPFRVDLARHIHRPHTYGAAAGFNYYFDTGNQEVRPLTTHGLYQRLPISHTIVRIYALKHNPDSLTKCQVLFANILDELLGSASVDDPTNM